MSDEQRTKNQVSYIFSKEVILKDLLQQGVISDLEFARYDEMLYDRYQLDAETGIPRPASPSISEQPEQPCAGKEWRHLCTPGDRLRLLRLASSGVSLLIDPVIFSNTSTLGDSA